MPSGVSLFTLTRSRVHGLLVVALAVLSGVLLEKATRSFLDPGGADPAGTPETALLLAQQLDHLSSRYLNPLSANGGLSHEDEQAVRSWMEFDRRFVELNQTRQALQFEVAAAARRIGYCAMLLADGTRSRTALNQAISIYARLNEEDPTSKSYRVEQAAARLQLSQLAWLEQNREEAIVQVRMAMVDLQLDEILGSEEFDDALKQLLSSCTELLVTLGEPRFAQELASVNIRVLERVIARSGGSPEDIQALHRARIVASPSIQDP